MTLVLPKDYHNFEALINQRIKCITIEEALKQDIRALRIAVLNIMPKAEDYEFNLLYPLGRSIIQIKPIWIRLRTHAYKSSDLKHINNFYMLFDDAIKKYYIDGLIVTGAPVEDIPFEKVNYWTELKEILEYARSNIANTLGICWGGLAIAKLLGIEKINYPKKLFGVFASRNLNRNHPITGDMDDIFYCPQSRHAGIKDDQLEEAARTGKVNLLAYSEKAGYFIFESSDGKFLIHLGHPEYNSSRLIEEYERDMRRKMSNVNAPENFDLKNPVNCWRSHRNEFFTQWIKYIYDNTDLTQ